MLYAFLFETMRAKSLPILISLFGTRQVGLSDRPDVHSVGTQFESRPGHRLS